MHFKIRELPFYSKSLELLTNFIITNIITNMDWITLPVKPLFPLSLSLLSGCAGSWLQCRGSSLLREGFSLVVASKGCSLVAMCGLLVAVGPVVAEHGLEDTQAPVIALHGLSCFMPCGILLDQGSNPCPLYWASQPLDHQGRHIALFLNLK